MQPQELTAPWKRQGITPSSRTFDPILFPLLRFCFTYSLYTSDRLWKSHFIFWQTTPLKKRDKRHSQKGLVYENVVRRVNRGRKNWDSCWRNAFQAAVEYSGMSVISFVVMRAASHEQHSVPQSALARGWWGTVMHCIVTSSCANESRGAVWCRYM
jgi:hypothetical protein